MQFSDQIGWGWEYVNKKLELYFMDAHLSKFNLINSNGALSVNTIKMEQLVVIE